jgi:3-(3-hydroxy-phenyl)propionate hydroxylase
MADDVWRLDYQMAPNADPEWVSREDVVRERLARQFGPDVAVEIVWVGPYAYRSECIDHMREPRHGRVFFMGDSAKVVSPFGARGGNTGIADADNLAWKLAAVLKGHAAPALLDSYHQERHEAARQNVQVTNRTARFLRPADGVERLFRTAAIGLAKQHLFARQLVNTGRMAIANPYTESSACENTGGLSVQNVGFEWADGSPGVTNDLLRWAHGRLLLLVFGALDADSQRQLRQLSQGAPLVAVQVLGASDLHPRRLRPAEVAREHVRDPQGHLRGACHVAGHRWALLRPDSYLAATGQDIDGALVRALEKSLGLATPVGNTA